MANRPLPSPEVLRQLLEYNASTGLLFWKPRPLHLFSSVRDADSWNTRYAGREAFTSVRGGYRLGSINDTMYSAHRIAWAIFYGVVPEKEIDHIDCDRSNNKICNLRIATRSQNQQNSKSQKTSTSKFKGVSWEGRAKKWRAQIKVQNGYKHLGYFDCEQKAWAAYKNHADIYYGEFARTD